VERTGAQRSPSTSEATGPSFSPPPSLVESIADELRRRTIAGVYRAGERLTEEALTRELGVSRPPLREAMRLLQQEGLLTAEPRRGVIVTPLTATDVREIYVLRHALERLAVELAVPISDESQLEPMLRAVDDMRRSVRKRDRAALTIDNLRFHQALVALAGNARLQRAFDGLMAQLQMCMSLNLRFRESLSGNLSDVVARHARLVELIRAGDPDDVKIALAEHGDRTFLEKLDELLDLPAGGSSTASPFPPPT
jgi:DNA-binding GntR family transcriptional regulator